MKLRSLIVKDLRQAIFLIEATPLIVAQLQEGPVTKEQLVQFFRDALEGAFLQTYLDFAERAGGAASARQVASAAALTFFDAMADTTLTQVNKLAGTADVDELMSEIRKAVLLTDRDAGALKAYDTELKTGSTRTKRRTLRDRRFDSSTRAGTPISASRRAMMVERYRQRLAGVRAWNLARGASRQAENATELAHWEDRAAEGDAEALEMRKFWENRGDGKVRHSHVEIPLNYPDGLPLDGVFVTEYGSLKYPLDSQAHPKDRGGCRCRLRFRRKKP